MIMMMNKQKKNKKRNPRTDQSHGAESPGGAKTAILDVHK